MFWKLNAMKLVAFFFLANTITLCVGGEGGDQIRSPPVLGGKNNLLLMREVYSKFLSPILAEAELIKQYHSFLDSRKRKLKQSPKLKNNEVLGLNEFLGLKLYTGDDFEIINFFSRNKKLPQKTDLNSRSAQKKLTRWSINLLEEVVEDIESGIKKLGEEQEKALFRGTTIGAKVFHNHEMTDIGNLELDDLFIPKGFVSTTLDWNTAAQFAFSLSQTYESTPVLLVFRKQNDKRIIAADISEISQNSKEKEKLLLPGVTYRVEWVEKNTPLKTSKDHLNWNRRFNVYNVTRV